ncbi:MAG: imelysin family protein [Pseudomonadota bacterium]
MRVLPALAVMLAITTSARAEVDHREIAERALTKVIEPGAEAFLAQTASLMDAAAACSPGNADSIRAAHQATWDSWMAIQYLTFGPLEEENRALQVAFWPDGRGRTGKTVSRLIRQQDAVVDDPGAFAQISVAGRGLYALERLLYDDAGPLGYDAYRCRYIAAAAADLARLAGEVNAEWQGDWSRAVREAGEPDNTIFLAPKEVSQRLLASTLGALELTSRIRLGKPLGTFESPKPRLAEAWRSGRSLRQIEGVLASTRTLVVDVWGPSLDAASMEQVIQVLDGADERIDEIREIGPLKDAVASNRLQVEILMQTVERVYESLVIVLGAELGIEQGFNSADGD